jgi:MHS family proline/betaine transporter-like MFS transporter
MIAVLCGVAPATFAPLLPTADRLSGYSFAFNLGLGVVGGSTLMVVTWLISISGTDITPAYYLILFALIAVERRCNRSPNHKTSCI